MEKTIQGQLFEGRLTLTRDQDLRSVSLVEKSLKLTTVNIYGIKDYQETLPLGYRTDFKIATNP